MYISMLRCAEIIIIHVKRQPVNVLDTTPVILIEYKNICYHECQRNWDKSVLPSYCENMHDNMGSLLVEYVEFIKINAADVDGEYNLVMKRVIGPADN